MPRPNIIVAGILDTKGKEIKYLARCVANAGGKPIIMELTVGGETGWADIGLSEVLAASKISMDQFLSLDRSGRAKALEEAAGRTLFRLHEEGRCQGIVAFGGSMGATIATAGMRALPIGVPKLMLSTINGQMRAYAGSKDICMMYSIAEAGLNRVTKKILNNAAYGIVGMAGASLPEEEEKPMVGLMMFGVTTPCVTHAAKYIEEQGYDVIINHATGSGGRSFEDMIQEGVLCGVLDITTHEVVSDIYGTRDTAGSSRLKSAAACGIPQVVSTGGADFLLYEDDEPVPQYVLAQAGQRGKYVHNPSVVNYGISVEEAYDLGCEYARRLNPAKAPTVLCVPMRGWCANDHGPESGIPGLLWIGDKQNPGISARGIAFAKGLAVTLKDRENPNLEALLVDRHINDQEFSQLMADLLTDMLHGVWQKGSRTDLPYVRGLRD